VRKESLDFIQPKYSKDNYNSKFRNRIILHGEKFTNIEGAGFRENLRMKNNIEKLYERDLKLKNSLSLPKINQ
jgi:hypothetical protein